VRRLTGTTLCAEETWAILRQAGAFPQADRAREQPRRDSFSTISGFRLANPLSAEETFLVTAETQREEMMNDECGMMNERQ
jgi:hypothetical protein